MKLPDFAVVVGFIRLRQAMGIVEIPTLSPVKFTREVRTEHVRFEEDPRDRELLNRLRAGAIEVSSSQVSVSDGLLTLDGRKIAAYIRDQRHGVDWHAGESSYRYHLTNCRTLERMRESGRERRYLATRRTDGLFQVNDLGWRERSGAVRLHLCLNCRELLEVRGKWFAPFSLAEYFNRHDSDVPRTIRRVEVVTTVQTYQPEQADLSREYRAAVNYRCQLCRLDCRHHPQLLHLHHRDGDPSNNTHPNLAVLCVECHAAQPMHGHMNRNPQFRQQLAAVASLRAQPAI